MQGLIPSTHHLTILEAPSLEGLFLGTGVSISPRMLSRDRSALAAVGRATCPEGPVLFLAGALAVVPEGRAAGR